MITEEELRYALTHLDDAVFVEKTIHSTAASIHVKEFDNIKMITLWFDLDSKENTLLLTEAKTKKAGGRSRAEAPIPGDLLDSTDGKPAFDYIIMSGGEFVKANGEGDKNLNDAPEMVHRSTEFHIPQHLETSYQINYNTGSLILL